MPILSEACERNKGPILNILKRIFTSRTRVLEIGSGTGQHALYFAEHLPHLVWQTSDFGDYLSSLSSHLEIPALPNLRLPIELDVRVGANLPDDFDAVFSANTLHIMSADAVGKFFSLVGDILPLGGLLVVYGPFNYGGKYSSASNQQFDVWLKSRDLLSGIRDFEMVDSLAKGQGLDFVEDRLMPANNQCIVWQKIT